MKHVKIEAFDIPDAWFKVNRAIHDQGEIFKVGYGSEETLTRKLNVSIVISHPENRPLTDEKAPCDMAYVQEYALRYLWCGEVQEGETYTYGGRLRAPVDQIEEAIKRWCECDSNRQTTMVIRLPEDIFTEQTVQVPELNIFHVQVGTKTEKRRHEPPCLSLIDTEIIDNKMHFTCYFRSWDAFGGLPANIAGIQLFNEAFVREINERSGKNIETGMLIFHSKNCHQYERQFPYIEELLNPKKTPKED